MSEQQAERKTRSQSTEDVSLLDAQLANRSKVLTRGSSELTFTSVES